MSKLFFPSFFLFFLFKDAAFPNAFYWLIPRWILGDIVQIGYTLGHLLLLLQTSAVILSFFKKFDFNPPLNLYWRRLPFWQWQEAFKSFMHAHCNSKGFDKYSSKYHVVTVATFYPRKGCFSFFFFCSKFTSLVAKSPRCPMMKMQQNVSRAPRRRHETLAGATGKWLGWMIHWSGRSNGGHANTVRHTDPAQELRAPPRATTCS